MPYELSKTLAQPSPISSGDHQLRRPDYRDVEVIKAESRVVVPYETMRDGLQKFWFPLWIANRGNLLKIRKLLATSLFISSRRSDIGTPCGPRIFGQPGNGASESRPHRVFADQTGAQPTALTNIFSPSVACMMRCHVWIP